jgi:peptidoglycan/xylan/chitin deacetylase (PgdA/CDA1 family)
VEGAQTFKMNPLNRVLTSPRIVTYASRLHGMVCSGLARYSDDAAGVVTRIPVSRVPASRISSAQIPSAQFRPDDQKNERILYLTFDDGPGPVSMDVITELNSLGAAATFFFLGSAMSGWEDPGLLVSTLTSGGHAIGLHGFNHLNAWGGQLDDIVADQRAGLDAITSVVGGVQNALQKGDGDGDRQIRWARPPYGRLTKGLLDWYGSQNLRVALWDVTPVDYYAHLTGRSATDVIQFIRRTVRPGSLVLLHANCPVWGMGLSELFRTLIDDGWTLAALPMDGC